MLSPHQLKLIVMIKVMINAVIKVMMNVVIVVMINVVILVKELKSGETC